MGHFHHEAVYLVYNNVGDTCQNNIHMDAWTVFKPNFAQGFTQPPQACLKISFPGKRARTQPYM